MFNKILFVALALFLIRPATSSRRTDNSPEEPSYFCVSPLVNKGYNQILNLRFAEARQTLSELQRTEPGNLLAPLLEDYLDFFTVFINDERSEYKRLSKNKDARLTRIAQGPRESPWFLYAQAEIRLHWAILHSRQGNELAAFFDIKQAYSLLEQNHNEHPDFIANLKNLGVLHALVGNVPDGYRWGLRVISGMSGSVAQGLGELKSVLEHTAQQDFLFETETRVAYAFLQLHLNNNPDTAWEILNSEKIAPDKSPLAAYARASLAMRTGRNDQAIQLLKNCPEGPAYHPFPYRYYLLGIARLNRLDADADRALHWFLKTFKGKSGIKETYQKLAWHQLIFGNPGAYRYYMNKVKESGDTRSEPDKAAQREAEADEIPGALLTRARLLFDGGYYQRAYELLQAAAAAYTGSNKSALEYNYRLGRIADALGKTDEAIRLYTKTVDAGARKPWYFACNAALQLGLLYEKQGEKPAARAAFRRCLAMRPEVYTHSLHAKAKAGLERVGN